MRRCWHGNPHLYIPLAAYGALHRPAAIDEVPVPPEMARQPVEVDIAHVRSPSLQARRTLHERAYAGVDQLDRV